MRSLVDPNVAISTYLYAISVICYGYHASILIEREESSGGRYLRRIDFVPISSNRSDDYYCYGFQFSQFLFNTTEPAIVRNENLIDSSGSNLQRVSNQGQPNEKIHTLPQTQDGLFKILRSKEKKAITWTVKMTRDVFSKRFYDVVEKERQNPSKCPRFNVQGKTQKVDAHNCCTWVIERLSLIDIKVPSQYMNTNLGITSLDLPAVGKHTEKTIDLMPSIPITLTLYSPLSSRSAAATDRTNQFENARR